jgi:uncharacterized protein
MTALSNSRFGGHRATEAPHFANRSGARVAETLRYDKLVETALRGVVREVLTQTAAHGLPGNHHFYITFRTAAAGVTLPDYLRQHYPDEMTVVLENQFWDLAVDEGAFAVTLSFRNQPERLTVPFAAITAFADPSVKFGLQFQSEAAPAPAPPPETDQPAAPRAKEGEVVALDAFRKK